MYLCIQILYLWVQLLGTGPQWGCWTDKGLNVNVTEVLQAGWGPATKPFEDPLMSTICAKWPKPAANQASWIQKGAHLSGSWVKQGGGGAGGQGGFCLSSIGNLQTLLSTLNFCSPEVTTLPWKFFTQHCLQSFAKAKSFTFYTPGVLGLERANAQHNVWMIWRNQMRDKGAREAVAKLSAVNDGRRLKPSPAPSWCLASGTNLFCLLAP